MRMVPSSSMSIWTSKSASSERIVSPPFPITIPMYSGLIWIDEMRGAWPASSARLRERALHDLARDPRDLDVHLERGDPVARAGDLEVHVAEVVLRPLDVREDDVVVALLDEAHRDAGDRRLDRDPGVHQRERRAADGAHRRRAVRLERLGDEAD